MLTRIDIKIIKELLAEELKPLKQDVQELKSDMKAVKRDTTKIRKDLEMVTGEFDKEQVSLKKRVDRIENHIGLTPL